MSQDSAEDGKGTIIPSVESSSQTHNYWNEDRILIGIGGAPGSRKTRTALRLADAINTRTLGLATVISMDRFYKDRSQINEEGIRSFNDPRSIDWDCFNEAGMRVLTDYTTSAVMELPVYNFPRSARTGMEKVIIPKVVIIEGCFLMESQTFKGKFTATYYCHESNDNRLDHTLFRCVNHRGRTKEEVTDDWEQHAVPYCKSKIEPTIKNYDYGSEPSLLGMRYFWQDIYPVVFPGCTITYKYEDTYSGY